MIRNGPDSPNRSPLRWQEPRSERPADAWYDPRLIAWTLLELVHLLRWALWHKWQSVKARRTTVCYETLRALQGLENLGRDDDLSAHQRKQVRNAQRALTTVCEELNLEDERVGRYSPEGSDDGD